jgi:hypothetical protein
MGNQMNIIDDAKAFKVNIYGQWVEVVMGNVQFVEDCYNRRHPTTDLIKFLFKEWYNERRDKYNASQTNNHLVEFEKLKNLDKLYTLIDRMAGHVVSASEF